ncbi:MAG: hypothetical protein ACOX9C_09600 [Kiritimatiellia bacterium]|jgi:hypothetical protein
MKRMVHKGRFVRNPLAQSALKNIERFVGAIVNASVEPHPGAPLLVNLAVAIEHSGVYLGDGEVAELHGSGGLRRVSLDTFRDGEDEAGVRTGAFVYAACDRRTGRVLGSEGAARMARAIVEKVGRLDYNILFNNCHLFTATCLLERLPSKERTGIFTAAALEAVVAARLNAGRPVAWHPVCGYDADPGLLPRKFARLVKKEMAR